MSTFLTIAEFSKRTGKSQSTIRRFVKSITDVSGHSDRGLIEPSPSAVEKAIAAQEPFTWMIGEALLERFPVDEAKREVAEKAKDSAIGSELLRLLREEMESREKHLASVMEQLKVKDTQMEKQSEIIQSLNERLREGNMLVGALQQQLQLGEAPKKKETEQREVVEVSAKSSKPRKKSKGMFLRWFR